MIHKILRTFSLIVALGFAISVKAEDKADFSPANQLLFFSNHLGNIEEPAALRYSFESSGTVQGEFNDSIEANIREVLSDNSRNVEVRYFSGERKRFAPLFEKARGNPVLTIFLQRSVNLLARLIKTEKWRYIQKQVKLALENNAKVSAVELEVDGKMMRGTEISIAPLQGKSIQEKFGIYTDVTYVFTLADALPGRIYQIRAATTDDHHKTIMEETLTYQGTSDLRM